MTVKELIFDTIKYYEEDPSRVAYCSKRRSCSYLTLEGKQCAVGRWIDPDKLERYKITWDDLDIEGGVQGANELMLSEGGITVILKDEVKEVPYFIWDSLQNFHDTRPLLVAGDPSLRAQIAKDTLLKLVEKL